MTLIKSTFAHLAERAGLVAMLGSASGWFSWDMIAHAKDAAQLAAAVVAFLVSVCALIISAPRAIANLRSWWRSIFNRQ